MEILDTEIRLGLMVRTYYSSSAHLNTLFHLEIFTNHDEFITNQDGALTIN